LGFQVSANWQTGVRLARHREETFLLGRGKLPWFGELITITA
jgi:hypothetical protein